MLRTVGMEFWNEYERIDHDFWCQGGNWEIFKHGTQAPPLGLEHVNINQDSSIIAPKNHELKT